MKNYQNHLEVCLPKLKEFLLVVLDSEISLNYIPGLTK